MASPSSQPSGPAPARHQRDARRGVAVTEFAVIVPVLVLVVFGGLSAAHLITLKHSAKHLVDAAAFAVMRGETPFAEIESHFESQAELVGLTGFEMVIARQPGDMARVSATLPVAPNNPLRGFTHLRQVGAAAVVYAPEEGPFGAGGDDDDDDDDFDD